ncbi:uncharacterized protein IAS62_001358 [Cryptococcus decagattii]|uniref:Cation/H+ exchanger transmembrane domain-containing protein n=1 Tax=Cryptococcus decagattii TaxID=1859122 RepID=A0ABZ2ANE6_9TREE
MTAFHPFEVTVPHLAYAFLGGFVVIFGMVSLFVKEKLYVGEAPIATLVGIIIGPHCLNLFNPLGWGGGSESTADDITLEVTRVVIAISVFAVGVELPKAYMKRHWRSLFFLLGPCMVWGWMVSALLIWGLIPGLTFLASLVVAAGVTPTDPILAQAVIGGKFADKHVPAHIRHLLSAESGSNDGAAFPFLYIALYLLLDSSPGHAVGEWFYMTWAYEIILGVVIGAVLGFCARKFMKFAERKRLIDRQSYVAQYVSLAVLSIGVTSLLGSDDLLSAFACGCAFAWDGFFNKATEDAVFSNVIDLLFNCAAFIYIGAIIPFNNFNDLPDLRVWRLVVLAILILLVRRLPSIIACYKFIPDIKTFREALFTGWFGPMGVGAVFISTLARSSLPEGEPDKNTEAVDRLKAVIMPVTLFLVLSSIVTRQEIIVNRDDDDEEGDLGVRRKDAFASEANGRIKEKIDEEDSGESSSSRTRQGEMIEMKEKRDPSRRGSRGSQASQASQGEAAEEGERWRSSGEGSSDVANDPETQREVEEGREEIGDKEGGGRRTPTLAKYREGNHLIVERKIKDSDEVEVEVIRNHFADNKKTESDRFTHPHRLKSRELDDLLHHLPKSLEHATSRVQNGGKDAVDRLGLGLMATVTPEPTPSIGSHDSPRHDYGYPLERTQSPEGLAEEGRDGESLGDVSHGGAYEEDEADYEDVPEETPRQKKKKMKPPAIVVSRQNSAGPPRRSIRSRLFGRRQHSSNSSSRAEEGLAPPNPSLLTPSPSLSRPQTIAAEPESILAEDSRGSSSSSQPQNLAIPLTRTLSASRSSPAVRFADDTSPSTDTAPGQSNYGSNAPGFKKNPALAMYRSTSVQSTGSNKDGPSVSFVEPEIKR